MKLKHKLCFDLTSNFSFVQCNPKLTQKDISRLDVEAAWSQVTCHLCIQLRGRTLSELKGEGPKLTRLPDSPPKKS